MSSVTTVSPEGAFGEESFFSRQPFTNQDHPRSFLTHNPVVNPWKIVGCRCSNPPVDERVALVAIILTTANCQYCDSPIVRIEKAKKLGRVIKQAIGKEEIRRYESYIASTYLPIKIMGGIDPLHWKTSLINEVWTSLEYPTEESLHKAFNIVDVFASEETWEPAVVAIVNTAMKCRLYSCALSIVDQIGNDVLREELKWKVRPAKKSFEGQMIVAFIVVVFSFSLGVAAYVDTLDYRIRRGLT